MADTGNKSSGFITRVAKVFLLVGSMTTLSVAFCPIAGLVECVVLAIGALLAPDIVVALRDNHFFVGGQRDDDIAFTDGVYCFRNLVELGAPFAVTGAVVVGTVNQGIQ